MGAVFTCSIDDGDLLDRKTAELLAKHGLAGTFFIPISNREGFPVLSSADIRMLGKYFEIGSHTFDHCYLNSTSLAEARYQISEGKKRLEDLLGKEAEGFCYPGGQYRQEHVDTVKSCGFRYARTTMNLCCDAGVDRFEMPTTLQFYPHDRYVYLRNFIKWGRWSARSDALRLVLGHSGWVERLYALFDHACREGGVFHLWGHSKEIEEANAWHEFDRFLAHVAASVAAEDRLTNAQLVERGTIEDASLV